MPASFSWRFYARPGFDRRLRMSCDALFNTRCFVLGFLPIVLAGYWLLPSRRAK